MIKQTAIVINDFGGGQDTKTPILSMPISKSPNMRNWHCSGTKERLVERGGFDKLNSSAVPLAYIDVSYPPGFQTYDYPHRDTATHTEISQGFKPATSGELTKVCLWLKKLGAPAGDITLTIQTDASGVPSGTPIADGTATVVAAASLATDYGWIEFTFAANPTVVAGTQYHICISSDVAISDTVLVYWGADDYDVIYPNGSMSYNDGATWVAASSYDAIFEVYVVDGARSNDCVALWDFNSRRQLIGVFGVGLYKMDKDSTNTPDGTWDSVGGGTAWDANVKLIAHWDGADAATAYTTEDDGARTVTFVANAQLDTAQKKFGASSLYCANVGDYVTIPDSDDWDFGTADFTIDFWVRLTDNAHNIGFWDIGDHQNYMYWNNDSGNLRIVLAAVQVYNVAWAFAINTWYHIAVSRSGTNLRVFIDGTQLGATVTNDSNIQGGANTLLVCNANDYRFAGWMDEPRISKGIARWTANFTAPTAAYSASAITVYSSRFLTFADWKSGRMLMNTDAGLYSYIGTGNLSSVAAAPIGKFMTTFKNYVFMAGIRGSPNEVRYSDVNDYSAWTSTNSLTLHTNDGDVITGMRELRGRLYIFKRYSIHRISYVGSNPTFQVDPIIGVGTPSHYSIKEIDMGGDVGSVLCFLTTDKKLAVFNGYDLEYVNDTSTEKTNDLFQAADDQPIALSDINMTYSDLIHAQVKKSTSEYILYVPLNTDTTIGYAFVFDYKTGGLFPYDNQPFASSAIVISTSKSKLLYAGGYSGYVYLTESGDDDDGTAIRAYWVSSKFKPDALGLMSKGLLLGVKFKEIYSLSALNMSFQFRLDQNAAWTSAQNFAYNRADEYEFGKVSMFDIGTVYNMFQVKIINTGSNPAPTLYGLELYGEPLGVNVKDRATA